MPSPSVEAIYAKLREIGEDARSGVDLAPPVTPGSMTWLKERFLTKLERELPADLAALLEVCDGAHINHAVLLGSRGEHGLVDHNLELRRPPGKWLPGQIVFGTEGKTASYVIEIDAGAFHVSDYTNPRWLKTFPSFPELFLHILRSQLGLRVRNL